MKECKQCKEMRIALQVIRTWANCNVLHKDHVLQLIDKALKDKK